MDKTYFKVKEPWFYLYRAVDEYGDTVDSMLSENGMKPQLEASLTTLSGSTVYQGRWLLIKMEVTAHLSWQLWFAGMAAYIR